ncbi:HIRAN domain-containing protein [Curtobacterium sp. MCBD17_040]|uniref:HIRAN domain-containing protein n=1 Tax=Curtobacterium sp. MCBD17_040 TaxID=2175674 RepID=UPI0015E87CE4|nr:HIRAN domain-containing protein [Curtobacterium sp. MCBD17_040]WIB65394.1 HIRAN domain-containing protein [Curtobacterium sp. MCBD17_040]
MHDQALWFEEETTGQLVNVANGKLRSLGLWTGQLRGTEYLALIIKHADLSPGAALSLVREPDNEADPYAVCVHADAGPVGYVNKRMARPLAKELDAGVSLRAVSLGGRRWMAADPDVVAWLLGRRT